MKYSNIILGIILLILLSYSLDQNKKEGHRKQYAGDTFVTCTKEYKYTGKIVPFLVPDGVFELDVQLYGGQGGITRGNSGKAKGGMGGKTSGRLAVEAGKTIYIYVGGQGHSFINSCSGPGKDDICPEDKEVGKGCAMSNDGSNLPGKSKSKICWDNTHKTSRGTQKVSDAYNKGGWPNGGRARQGGGDGHEGGGTGGGSTHILFKKDDWADSSCMMVAGGGGGAGGGWAGGTGGGTKGGAGRGGLGGGKGFRRGVDKICTWWGVGCGTKGSGGDSCQQKATNPNCSGCGGGGGGGGYWGGSGSLWLAGGGGTGFINSKNVSVGKTESAKNNGNGKAIIKCISKWKKAKTCYCKPLLKSAIKSAYVNTSYRGNTENVVIGDNKPDAGACTNIKGFEIGPDIPNMTSKEGKTMGGETCLTGKTVAECIANAKKYGVKCVGDTLPKIDHCALDGSGNTQETQEYKKGVGSWITCKKCAVGYEKRDGGRYCKPKPILGCKRQVGKKCLECKKYQTLSKDGYKCEVGKIPCCFKQNNVLCEQCKPNYQLSANKRICTPKKIPHCASVKAGKDCKPYCATCDNGCKLSTDKKTCKPIKIKRCTKQDWHVCQTCIKGYEPSHEDGSTCDKIKCKKISSCTQQAKYPDCHCLSCAKDYKLLPGGTCVEIPRLVEKTCKKMTCPRGFQRRKGNIVCGSTKVYRSEATEKKAQKKKAKEVKLNKEEAKLAAKMKMDPKKYKKWVAKMKNSSIANCRARGADYKCKECDEGHYLNPKKTNCIKIINIPHCKTQDMKSEKKCIECKEFFKLSKDKKSCVANPIKWCDVQSAAKCTKCKQLYSLDKKDLTSRKCTANLIKGCAKGKQKETKCTGCLRGYNLKTDKSGCSVKAIKNCIARGKGGIKCIKCKVGWAPNKASAKGGAGGADSKYDGTICEYIPIKHCDKRSGQLCSKCSKKYKLAKDKKSCVWDGCKETKLKRYSYKGSSSSFTVPAGVTELQIELSGAKGGDAQYRYQTWRTAYTWKKYRYWTWRSSSWWWWNRSGYWAWKSYRTSYKSYYWVNRNSKGGWGGKTSGILKVKKGDKIYIFCGGKGTKGSNNKSYGTVANGTAIKGGFNGGGSSGKKCYEGCGSGGGATDIRLNGTALSNRVMVAGGGGGGYGGANNYNGGKGGGATGGSGVGNKYGEGGTNKGGGRSAGWITTYGRGNIGKLGVGGNGNDTDDGAGGGGGYYGGGGGGINSAGGGGSCWVNSSKVTKSKFSSGINSGNGYASLRCPNFTGGSSKYYIKDYTGTHGLISSSVYGYMGKSNFIKFIIESPGINGASGTISIKYPGTKKYLRWYGNGQYARWYASSSSDSNAVWKIKQVTWSSYTGYLIFPYNQTTYCLGRTGWNSGYARGRKLEKIGYCMWKLQYISGEKLGNDTGKKSEKSDGKSDFTTKIKKWGNYSGTAIKLKGCTSKNESSDYSSVTAAIAACKKCTKSDSKLNNDCEWIVNKRGTNSYWGYGGTVSTWKDNNYYDTYMLKNK
jgi:hypothetical protein